MVDKVVIKRKSNDYENDKENYESRTITLNGQKILDGNKYLIPWNWDENGKQLAVRNKSFIIIMKMVENQLGNYQKVGTVSI